MRNSKFLATAIVAIMLSCVLAVASFAAVTPFTDVDDKKNETLSDAVALLEGIGVTKGTSETTFGTMELVTRQQMAAFVYRLFRPEGQNLEGLANNTPFTDLSDSTYFGYIAWANGKGVIKGTSETTFNPTGGIMLQDAYTMLVRALGHETDEYIYPFTYIDKAEELGLDDGLDSVVGYTTKLTRGDVAVVLYNTFFADTSKQVNKTYFSAYEDDYYRYVREQQYVSLAEDVYDMQSGKFKVRATNKYAFNDSVDLETYEPLCNEFSEDTLQLVALDKDEPVSEFYWEFADTGLKGTSDDYIMNDMEVFYTYTEENGQHTVDKVYFMNGQKRVLETNNAVGYWIEDPDDDGDYFKAHPGYEKNKNHRYTKIEGYITVGTENIYFFDAPYTYIKPNYNSIDMAKIKEEYGDEASDVIADIKKTLRNKNNIQLIGIKSIDFDDGTYSYYLDTKTGVNSAESLYANLNRVYSKGVYTLKFFDNNSDGVYDYAMYMPATYGFMKGDSNKDFATDMKGNAPLRVENKGSDLDVPFVPTIYYNGANITGTSFADGDFVVAYLNPEANMIHVTSVVKPYNGYVAKIRYSSGLVTIDGQNFQTAQAYRVVEEFWDGDNSAYWNYEGKTYTYYDYYHDPSLFYLKKDSWRVTNFPNLINKENTAVGEIVDLYAYKLPGAYNQILWYDHLEDASMSFEMDELAIPVGDKKNAGETYTEFEFDNNLGEKVHYANLYYNGKISYMPLDTDDMQPGLGEGYKTGRYNLSLIKGYDGDDGYVSINRAYVDKLCKVKIDENGHITLVPLLHTEDEEGIYAGTNRDSGVLEDGTSRLFGNDLSYERNGVIKKIAGSRFALLDIDDTNRPSLLGDIFGNAGGKKVKYFEMNAATRIIIKNITEKDDYGVVKDFEYLEFDASTFKGSTSEDTPLTNIQYILRADPESNSKARLVILYAEAENFEFEVKTTDESWRIVTDSYVRKDDESEFRNYYRLFNVYTGAIEEEVAGEEHETKASAIEDAVDEGVIVKIKNGVVDEDGKLVGNLASGLVYITEYDETFSYMGVVPVEAMEAELERDGSLICCGEEFRAYAEDFVYNGDEKNFDGEKYATVVDANGKAIYGNKLFYEITSDTIITVINAKEEGVDALAKADFKLGEIAAIAGNQKEYRSYNEKVLNKKGNYATAYADYIKAYVYAEAPKAEDILPEASFVIVVVNGNEDLIFADYDSKYLTESHDKH